MKRSIQHAILARGAWLCAGAAVAAPDYGNCEVTGERGSIKLETVKPGVLSVRPSLPAPGYWNGDTPDTIKDGFEYCLAANIAHRAGLDKIDVVIRSFPQVISGQAKGFDIALSQTTITEARKKVVDFTEPYFHADQGILVKKGANVTNDNIASLNLGARQGTTTLQYLLDHIKPEQQPKVYVDNAPMYAALAAGQVDAILYDTPNVLARAKASNGKLEVVGRYDTQEYWGGLVNKGSPNMDAFNKVLRELKEDGTIQRLTDKYLTPQLGMDPAKVPLFEPKS